MWSTRANGKERIQKRSDLSLRSLVKRRKESEPALISVNFSLLLRLNEVKYHWSKSGKGDKAVNLIPANSHALGVSLTPTG